MSVCVVCSSPSPKYKCPTCSQQYCSLSCCKIHKDSHPSQPEVSRHILPEISATSKPVNATSVTTSSTSGAFASLISSGQLDALLGKYPSLRLLLRQIYMASADPNALQPEFQVEEQSHVSRGNFRGRSRSRGGGGRWNAERGTRDGLSHIRKARELEGREGEGMQEFIQLVLMNAQEADGCFEEATTVD